jgi:hypothetical protein
MSSATAYSINHSLLGAGVNFRSQIIQGTRIYPPSAAFATGHRLLRGLIAGQGETAAVTFSRVGLRPSAISVARRLWPSESAAAVASSGQALTQMLLQRHGSFIDPIKYSYTEVSELGMGPL